MASYSSSFYGIEALHAVSLQEPVESLAYSLASVAEPLCFPLIILNSLEGIEISLGKNNDPPKNTIWMLVRKSKVQ